MKIRQVAPFALLWVFSIGVCHPPAFAAPDVAKLPAEVRAYLPKGATSFLAERLPVGYKGATRLVHIWGAVRPNTRSSLNQYDKYTNSPFCVDVFEPQLNSRKKWKWHLVSSAFYMDIVAPTDVIAHWLRPATKQGLVLEIISSNGAPGVSIQHTVFTWSQGLQEGCSSPLAQVFSSGSSGGGLIEQRFDGVDEDGNMTITTKNSYEGRTVSTRVHYWNGERFVAPKVYKKI